MANKFENYKYYRGEEESPVGLTEAQSLWWRIESYAYYNEDDKKPDMLSTTMCSFIRERLWEGDSYHEIGMKWEIALQRASEMYQKGVWDGDYLCRVKATLNGSK